MVGLKSVDGTDLWACKVQTVILCSHRELTW